MHWKTCNKEGQQEPVRTVYNQAVYRSTLLFASELQQQQQQKRVIGKSCKTAVRPAIMSAFEQRERKKVEVLEIFLRGDGGGATGGQN